MGLGAGALANLLSPEAFALKAPQNPLLPRKPHFSEKAKRVIYIHLTGSPPHLDMWDYKPELVKRTDQDCPDEFVKGKMFAFTSGTPKLMGTPRTFKQYGKSGMWMSDAIPNFHEHADDFCVIKSMHTDQFNHAPAELFVHTGFPQPGRPSFGAWTTYGLGSEKSGLTRICGINFKRYAAKRGEEFIQCRFYSIGLPGSTVPIQGRSRPLRF
jgi:hypothetical protein